MEELVYYSSLFDYYGNLLTKKEQEYFEDYYFNNLSLQEIANNYEVTRNAISKTLKESKEKLDYYILLDMKCLVYNLVPLNLFCVDDKGNYIYLFLYFNF